MPVTKKTKILVVDDDTDIVVLLSSFLAEEGFKVYTATKPQQALEHVQNFPIDLAIIDIALPEMNGVELLRKMKEIRPNIEAIMITAYKDAEKVVEAFRLGAFDCIFKPFDLKYLRRAIMAKMLE